MEWIRQYFFPLTVRSTIVDGVSVQSLQVPGKYFSWANQSAEMRDRLYTVFTLKLWNRKWLDESIPVHVERIKSSSQIVWFDIRQVLMHGSKFFSAWKFFMV